MTTLELLITGAVLVAGPLATREAMDALRVAADAIDATQRTRSAHPPMNHVCAEQ